MNKKFTNTQQEFWTDYTGQNISDEKAQVISSNLLAFAKQVVRMNEILSTTKNNKENKNDN